MLTNGNLLNGVPNSRLAPTMFSILLQVRCLLQIGRVYEWFLLPRRLVGGFCLLHIRKQGFSISGSWTHTYGPFQEWVRDLYLSAILELLGPIASGPKLKNARIMLEGVSESY